MPPGPTATRKRRLPGSLPGPAPRPGMSAACSRHPRRSIGFQILTIPGGFSYGDDLGAGRILATRLGHALGDALRRFHDRGGLIAGHLQRLPGPGPVRPLAWRIAPWAGDARPQRFRTIRSPLDPALAPARSLTFRRLRGTRSSCPSPTARESSSRPIPGHPRRSMRPARSC